MANDAERRSERKAAFERACSKYGGLTEPPSVITMGIAILVPATFLSYGVHYLLNPDTAMNDDSPLPFVLPLVLAVFVPLLGVAFGTSSIRQGVADELLWQASLPFSVTNLEDAYARHATIRFQVVFVERPATKVRDILQALAAERNLSGTWNQDGSWHFSITLPKVEGLGDHRRSRQSRARVHDMMDFLLRVHERTPIRSVALDD